MSQTGDLAPVPTYVTIFNLALTSVEAHLLFGRLRPSLSTKDPTKTDMSVELTTALVVNPSVLKDMARRLTETIAQFEADNGPIPEMKL